MQSDKMGVNHMKHILTVALAAIIAVTLLPGCSRKTAESGGNGKISVVATIFPPYDFARAVAGGIAQISMLLSPGAESHSFDPSPKDAITIQNCDVFIYVGGESDAWVEKILSSMDTSKMKIVTLMDCVETVEEETVDGMVAENVSGGDAPVYDEHVWTSPRNAKLIVQKIYDAISGADPENADIYRQNTAAYLAELDALDAVFQGIVDNSARKTLVFGDRFPFRYFADAYGLTYFAAFPGCSAETEASAATVKFLIDKINSEHIPVVFHIELSNEKIADTIAEATGAKVMLLHACHNISKEDFTAGKGYIEFMEANAEALREALR